MAAKREETVSRPNSVETEQLRPDLGKCLCYVAFRGDIAFVVAAQVRQGQRLAVHLAVQGHREGVKPDEMGRDHVVGEGCQKGAAQRRVVGCSAACGHYIGHETPVVGDVVPRHDERVTHSGPRS